MAEPTHWLVHLSAIDAEGVSVQAYARREGISAAALYYWRKRLKADAATAGEAPVPQLVAVQLPESSAIGQRCTLWLAPGVRLELSALPSANWLIQIASAACRQVR